MRPMSESEVNKELDRLPGWERQGNSIARVFARRTFQGAISFVNTVCEIATRADHHPDIDIRYNRVTLSLITHDSDGITRRDLDLAERIDAVTTGLA